MEAAQLAADYGGHIVSVYEHALEGFSVEISDAGARALARDTRVGSVYEDGVVRLAQTQSPAPWDLDRIDQATLPLDNAFTVDSTGASVHAYVIDSGIRTSHAEFGGRATVGTDAVGDGWNGQDCNGHGTMVAGLAGGTTYGVAKQASIVSVRVIGCGGTGDYSQVIAGVDWVTAHAVQPAVANMSLEGSPYPPLEAAISNSIASGVAYAVAAGNSGADACASSPALVPEAITVAATDANDQRPSWSNFGSCIDLFAPGVAVTSATKTTDTSSGSGNGTSFATPIVTGIAALVRDESPTLTPDAVATAIVDASSAGVVVNPGSNSPNRLARVVATPTAPPVSILADPQMRPLVEEMFGSDAGTVIAQIDGRNGTFTIGDCTSPLPDEPGDYSDAASGLTYQTVDGNTAGPLTGECRPDIVSVAGT